jgi:Chaperone of endosialidase
MADATFDKLTVNNNIGIGTETPNAQLHIDADVGEGKVLVESGSNLFKLAVDATGAAIGTANAVPFALQTDGSSRLTINPAGNIGIDKSNPGFKLDVNGIVNATGFNKGGTPWKLQTGDIEDNAITAAKIADLNVTTNELANAAVIESKLAANAVTAGKIADGAIATSKLAPAAVTADKLADNSVIASKIPDGAIAATKLAPGTIPANPWVSGASGQISYSGGNVGINTTTPTRAKLEVAGSVGATVGMFGADAQGVSLVASWPALGLNAYFNNGWKSIAPGWTGNIHVNQDGGGITLQIGQRSTTANAPITLANHFSVGADGAVSIPGKLNFGAQVRQMINLWNTDYGIGVQAGTQYFRTGGDFCWFRGGTHNDNQSKPGVGGFRLMAVNAFGDLILSARTNPEASPNKPLCRAMVDLGNKLSINHGGDFAQGVEVIKLLNGSSRTYKKNITSLSTEEATQVLQDLSPVKFNYLNDSEDELQLGFIAEDVPDLVATRDRTAIGSLDIVAVLTKVVQEQQTAIATLTDRVKLLEQRT